MILFLYKINVYCENFKKNMNCQVVLAIVFVLTLCNGYVYGQDYNVEDYIVRNSSGDRVLCCNDMQIAGLVIASIVFIALLGTCMYYMLRKKATTGYSQIF